MLADAIQRGLPHGAQECADWIAELASERSKRKHATAIAIDLAGAPERF